MLNFNEYKLNEDLLNESTDNTISMYHDTNVKDAVLSIIKGKLVASIDGKAVSLDDRRLFGKKSAADLDVSKVKNFVEFERLISPYSQWLWKDNTGGIKIPIKKMRAYKPKSNEWIYTIENSKEAQAKIIDELKKIAKPITPGSMYDKKTLNDLVKFFEKLNGGLRSTRDTSYSIGGNFRAHQAGFILQFQTNSYHSHVPYVILVKIGGATPSALKAALSDYIEEQFKQLTFEGKKVHVNSDYATNWSWVGIVSPYNKENDKYTTIKAYDKLMEIR